MPRIFANGREVDVPHDRRGRVDVNQLRDVMGVRRGRELILQRHSGDNIIMPKYGRFRVDPYSRFVDVGAAKRGSA